MSSTSRAVGALLLALACLAPACVAPAHVHDQIWLEAVLVFDG
jgi:hypothetical protein